MGGGVALRKGKIGIRKRQKKANLILAVLFLLILPVTAIIIGSKITKLWVIPTINTNNMPKVLEDIDLEPNEEEIAQGAEIEDKTTEEGNTINLSSISIYAVQVASVADNKNINLLTDQLKQYNLPHITYKIDNVYKIYTYASAKRENIEGKIDQVKEIYNDAYIGEIHIPQQEVYYLKDTNKGTEEIIEDINLLTKLLNRSSDDVYNINGGNIGEYRQVLEEYKNILTKILGYIDEGINLPEEIASIDNIKKVIEFQQNNVAESLKIIENKEDLYELQKYFSNNLFSMLELVRKY